MRIGPKYSIKNTVVQLICLPRSLNTSSITLAYSSFENNVSILARLSVRALPFASPTVSLIRFTSNCLLPLKRGEAYLGLRTY